jgi:hypothetical protein
MVVCPANIWNNVAHNIHYLQTPWQQKPYPGCQVHFKYTLVPIAFWWVSLSATPEFQAAPQAQIL